MRLKQCVCNGKMPIIIPSVCLFTSMTILDTSCLCSVSVLIPKIECHKRSKQIKYMIVNNPILNPISSCFCYIPRVGCRWSRQGFFDSTVVPLCAGWGVILLADPPVTALVSRGLKQIPFSGPHSGYENVSPNSWVTFC